jgi:hypothetical protein
MRLNVDDILGSHSNSSKTWTFGEDPPALMVGKTAFFEPRCMLNAILFTKTGSGQTYLGRRLGKLDTKVVSCLLQTYGMADYPAMPFYNSFGLPTPPFNISIQ